LALPAPGCEEDKEPLVCCGIVLSQKRVEPAGRAFHAAREKPVIDAKKKGRPAPAKAAAEEEDDDGDAAGDASWKKKKRKDGGDKRSGSLKLNPLLEGQDLYALLEVTETASVDQIKKQYRKLALKHHPDKQDHDASKEKKDGLTEGDQLFIKIQEAYEILSDTAKRQQYDSTLEFDDEVPEEVDEAKGFYDTFGPVFQRNARWSVRHPVPELGSDKTDIAKVHRFYDFWFNFESWRDFSMHDEYNLEDAEFREERRWMERQNKKVRKEFESDERRRVLRLAEAAERFDPRIRAEREEREAKKREEKERRARLKQEEEDAKRREEEAKKQKALQEQQDKEEKERLEKEQRKQKQQVAKGLRQRAKKAVQAKGTLPADMLEDLQDMCLSLDVEPLEALCGRLEALPSNKEKAAIAIKAELEEWRKNKADEQQQQQAKQREENKKRDDAKEGAAGSGTGTPWAAEEMGMLAKGLQKFPGGVGGRWALISQFLSTSGFSRTEKEVIEKTKEMSDGQSLRSMGSQIAADLTNFKAKAGAKAAPAPKAKAAAAAPEAPQKASPGPAAAAPAPLPAAGDDWSAEQQRSLEAALQKHPASLDKNERWRLIAEDVPGKTKSQCVERFKYLRTQLIKK